MGINPYDIIQNWEMKEDDFFDMACIQSSFIGSTYLHLDEIYINIYENNLYGTHKALKLKIKEFIKENEEYTVCDKSDKSHIRGMKLFNKILEEHGFKKEGKAYI